MDEAIAKFLSNCGLNFNSFQKIVKRQHEWILVSIHSCCVTVSSLVDGHKQTVELILQSVPLNQCRRRRDNEMTSFAELQSQLKRWKTMWKIWCKASCIDVRKVTPPRHSTQIWWFVCRHFFCLFPSPFVTVFFVNPPTFLLKPSLKPFVAVLTFIHISGVSTSFLHIKWRCS